MFGRRTVSAIAVVAAVGAGGVVGALIGIPGSSGASTSATTQKSTDGQKPPDTDKGPRFGAGFGPALGADKDVLDAGAKALHVSTADLLKKLSNGKTTIADVAKDQNVNVQDVIDAMAAVAKTDITNLVNNPFPAFPNFKGGPLGPDVIGPGFGFGGGMRDDTFGAAAKALGITEKELLADLGNGQSIADVAKAKHVSVDTVIGAIVTDTQSQIDAAVKAKHLTQDQATKLESNLKDRITNLVNNTGPSGPGKFGHFGRGFRSGGPGGFGPGGFGPGGPGGPGGSSSAAPAAGASTS